MAFIKSPVIAGSPAMRDDEAIQELCWIATPAMRGRDDKVK